MTTQESPPSQDPAPADPTPLQKEDDGTLVLQIQDGPVDSGGRPWTGPPPK